MADAPKPDLTNGGKLPWFRRERRQKASESRLQLLFTMALSAFLIVASMAGAFLVMLDPVGIVEINGYPVKIGGEGFAEQMKGAVLTLILIGGFTAVVNFWIRISNQEARAQEATTSIAQAAAPAAAAATQKALEVVAALPPAPIVPIEPVVTPAPATPEGIIPAAEVAQPKKE